MSDPIISWHAERLRVLDAALHDFACARGDTYAFHFLRIVLVRYSDHLPETLQDALLADVREALEQRP